MNLPSVKLTPVVYHVYVVVYTQLHTNLEYCYGVTRIWYTWLGNENEAYPVAAYVVQDSF